MISKRPIQIDELEIGQVLTGSILDADDKVLFREGLTLTPQMVELWKRRADGPFFLSERTPDVTAAAAPGSRSYDAAFVELIDQWFTEAIGTLENFVTQLVADQTPSMRQLESCLDKVFPLIQRDSDCLVQHIITQDRGLPDDTSITRRSVYLSVLSSIVAREYGLNHEDCYKVALAGMLHDLALFPQLLSKLQDSFEEEDDKQSVITRHSYMSTDLLTARVSVPDIVRVIINQVHEQMDGSGYPRGIPGHLINVMARVINLNDAFLTLISASSEQPGYVPGDAIAYLIHHTSRGAFDRECMRAFLSTVTMYGIGCRVQLEDGTEAKILRSVPGCPLQPLVVGSAGDGAIVDLTSENSRIVGPLVEPEYTRRTRMSKSLMAEVLWKQVPAFEVV